MKKGKEPGEMPEDDTQEIETLSDDCLIEIFKRLMTIAGKILRGVCNRWRNLSSKHVWTSFTTLDMSFDNRGAIKRYPCPKRYNDNRKFKIRECNKLQKISLYRIGITAAMEDIFEAFAFQAENLRSLCFMSCLHYLSSRILSNFSRLENLERLFFIGTNIEHISDTFLAAIVSTCKKLTHLSLKCEFFRVFDQSANSTLIDDRISSLVNLPKLKFLLLHDLPIRKPSLEKMHNLEILDVAGCFHLEEQTLCDFLKKAHSLRVILVEGHDITETFLKVAVETHKIRKSSAILEIVVDKDEQFSGMFLHEIPHLVYLYYGRNDVEFSRSIYWVECEKENMCKKKKVFYIENKNVLYIEDKSLLNYT